MKRLLFPMAISMAISVTSATTHQDLQNEIAALREMVLAQQDQIAALVSQKDAAHKAHKKMSTKNKVKSNFKSKVGGYVKVATHFDDNGKNFTSLGGDGVIGSGPVVNHLAGTEEHTNTFTANETRLNYTVWGPQWKGWDTKAFIEGHFYTGNFGLRHAFIDLKKDDKEILFGQYWSSFGSAKYIPQTADFAVGINAGGLFDRNEQLRYSDRIGSSDFKWQVALESDSTYAGSSSNNADMPFRVYSLEFSPKRKDARKAVYWHKVINTKASIDILDGTREVNVAGAGASMDIGGWALSTVFGVIEPKKGKKEGALTLAGSAYEGNGLSTWFQVNGGFGSTAAAGTTKAEASEGLHIQLGYYPKENIRLAISHGETEASFEDGYSLSAATQMTKNERDVFSVMWQDDSNLRYGVEYAKNTTTYQSSTTTAVDKDNNRISLFAQYSF